MSALEVVDITDSVKKRDLTSQTMLQNHDHILRKEKLNEGFELKRLLLEPSTRTLHCRL